MKLYKTSKVLWKIKDPSGAFLKGYGANTLDRPRNAFVDIKGKVVATFDQLKIAEEEMAVVLESSVQESLRKHLGKYLPICKADITEEPSYQIYFDLQGDFPLQEGEWALPQKKGQLLITSRDLESIVSEEEFTLFRLLHEIPIQGIDYDDEMLLNISPTEYTSFTKGCYLGQEVLSRVHFKSKPPRKLVVKKQSDCTPEELERMTSPAKDLETGQIMGFVFAGNK